VLLALLASLTGIAAAQKTDIIRLANGNEITGEIKHFDLGQVKFRTHAAGTIYVRWTSISTINSDKSFEVEFADGRKTFASLVAADPGFVTLISESDSTTVLTLSIVSLHRQKKSFFHAINGNIDLGFNFTQQANNVGLNFDTKLIYEWGLRGVSISANGSFNAQDSTQDITKATLRATYTKRFSGKWFYNILSTATTSSQLSLDYRVSVGGGAGRLLFRSSLVKISLGTGLLYYVEKFYDQSSSTSLAAFVLSTIDYFSWEQLNTTFSTTLWVEPILTDWGRVRIGLRMKISREIVTDLTVSLFVSETYDSRPPSVIANNNDFSLTSSIGWNF